jgi:hypothetical protein|tara:strand:+ start:1585 stop:2295 length:711 start_codon:yes stop_codon:yes gene_type:complete
LQKIAIFGDSYAVSGKDKQQITWADLLVNDYEIENFAVTGCGPDLQLERFLTYFKKDRSNDIIIFVLPHHLRLSLADTEPVEQVLSFLYLHDKVKGISKKIKERLKAIKWKDNHQGYQEYVSNNGKFLDLWYDKFLKSNTYLETEPLKISSLISKYRKLCKKVILVPIHPIHPNHKFLLEEDKFLIANITLRLLDESENVDITKIRKNKGIDFRAGHLGKENHLFVYNNLKVLIDG